MENIQGLESLNYWVVYVLKLEDGCYYVGSTTTLAFGNRMMHHWTHPTKGALWTRLHKPILVRSIDIYPRDLTDSQICMLEDKKTLHMAQAHGLDVVRGGGYCQQQPNWPLDLFSIKKKKGSKKQKENIARVQLQQSARLFGGKI